MWENIAGAKRYSRPRGFNIAGASAPVAPAVPTPLVTVHLSERSLVRRVSGPQGQWSERSVVRRVTDPKDQWSESCEKEIICMSLTRLALAINNNNEDNKIKIIAK